LRSPLAFAIKKTKNVANSRPMAYSQLSFKPPAPMHEVPFAHLFEGENSCLKPL
jgi:hypothetical protein